MQFSILLLSAAALVPSALACLNVTIAYTLEGASGTESHLKATFLDNGYVTCYYNIDNPPTSNKAYFKLQPNVANVKTVNETYQQCISTYHAQFQLDLTDTKDKKKNNIMELYEYTDSFGNSQSYGPMTLGERITTAATGSEPAIWSWKADYFC